MYPLIAEMMIKYSVNRERKLVYFAHASTELMYFPRVYSLNPVKRINRYIQRMTLLYMPLTKYCLYLELKSDQPLSWHCSTN